jgi:hypothetical protein
MGGSVGHLEEIPARPEAEDADDECGLVDEDAKAMIPTLFKFKANLNSDPNAI